MKKAVLAVLTTFIFVVFVPRMSKIKAQITVPYAWGLTFQPTIIESGRTLVYPSQASTGVQVNFKQPFFGNPACQSQAEIRLETPTTAWSNGLELNLAFKQSPADAALGAFYISWTCAGAADRTGVWVHLTDGTFAPF